MLQLIDGTVREDFPGAQANLAAQCYSDTTAGGLAGTVAGNFYVGDPYVVPQVVQYWNTYPIYVCTDKTKKAIEILKALESNKIVELKSVKRFIDLVEQIANIL
jgi:hypothetical protein